MNFLNSFLSIASGERNRVVVNGKEYAGKTVELKIVVDGEDVGICVDKEINIEVHGDVDEIHTASGDVKANNVGKVKTVSGDVHCDDVSGDVTTVSGDVKANSIHGKVKTISGDIHNK